MYTLIFHRASVVMIFHSMGVSLFLCINSPYQHCIQPPIEATIMYHHLYMYWSTPMFWALIQLFILLTLLWAWVCPHHPSTCHTFYVSHPLLGTINIKTKSHHGSNKEASLLHRSLQSLHYPHDPMMYVGHMMSSYPHTSGGNMLT